MSTDTERRRRFVAVAEHVHEPLQRYLRRRTDAAEVDDVFNDTLLVVWRRIDELPADEPLPWCYGVARRCLANHRRGDDRRLRLVDRVASEPGPSGSGDPAAAIDRSEPALYEAMASLSDAENEIVRLWAWEGLEPREIAVVLDTTPNAVSVALSRARRKLRDRLERQDPAGAGHQSGEHIDTDEGGER